MSDGTKAVAWLRDQIAIDQMQAKLAIGLRTAPGYRQDPASCRNPEDAIADSEAKLEILREHYILTNTDRSEAYEEYSVVRRGIPGGGGDTGMGCVCCHYQGSGGVAGYGVCRTVKALASAYKHREGYAGHWAEAGS